MWFINVLCFSWKISKFSKFNYHHYYQSKNECDSQTNYLELKKIWLWFYGDRVNVIDKYSKEKIVNLQWIYIEIKKFYLNLLVAKMAFFSFLSTDYYCSSSHICGVYKKEKKIFLLYKYINISQWLLANWTRGSSSRKEREN